MALTQTRTETNASDEDAAAASPPARLEEVVGAADHKTVGRLWIGSSLFFAVAALSISAVAAFEGIDLDSFSLVSNGPELVQLWSLGRDLLLFGAVVPALIGLATYVVPLQVGAPAIAFSRGAAGAFWTWLLATGLLIGSYVLNGGPGGGRIDYVVLWIVSLGVMAAALVWAMITIVTTVLGVRTTGMSLDRVPATSWSFLVFSLLGLFSLPVLVAELVLTYVRVRNGLVPLDARETLVGVMDSPNLVPALYWVAIPALGVAVDAIGVHTSRPVAARKPIMVALGLLGVLAFGAGYFGFASVRPLAFDHGVLVVTIAVALLALLAVLALASGSLRTGTPTFRVALIGSLVSGLVLLVGAAAALLGLAEPVATFLARETTLDIDLDNLLILNGTMFHDGIRGVVLGGAIVAVIAGLHHWSVKIWGRRQSELVGLLSVLAVALGAVLWGVGGVLAGIDDQPAYPGALLGGGENVEVFAVLTLVGTAMMAAGALLALLNAAGAAFRSSTALPANPWSGLTLEWATASPPPLGNFPQPPIVRSANPLVEGIGDAGDGSGHPAEGTDEGEEV